MEVEEERVGKRLSELNRSQGGREGGEVEATGAEEERVHVLLQACDSFFWGVADVGEEMTRSLL